MDDALVVGSASFLETSEIVEGIAFAKVGGDIVGIKADGPFKGSEGFLVALEAVEGIAYFHPILHGPHCTSLRMMRKGSRNHHPIYWVRLPILS